MGKEIKKVTTRPIVPHGPTRPRKAQTRSSASLSGVMAPNVSHVDTTEQKVIRPHIVHRVVHRFVDWGPIVRIYVSVGNRKRQTLRALLAVPYRVVLAVVLLVSLVGAFATYHGIGNAEVATYYPTACLGGWANPQLAEGEFKTTEVVNAENSAMYAGGEQAIFCGSFKGSTLENVELSTVTLTLGLSQVELNQAAVQGYIETPQLQDDVKSPAGSAQESGSEQSVEPAGEESQAEESVPAADVPKAPVETDPVEPSPTSEPVTSAEPSALHAPERIWSWLVRAAHAQEALPEPTTDIVSSTPTTSTESQTRTQSENSTPLAAPSEAATPAETGVSPEVVPQVGTTAASTDADVFSIRYSLDGSTWVELGTVGMRTFSKTFSVPVVTLPELAQMQINIVPTVQVVLAAPVFLNGIRLDVEYTEAGTRTPPTPETDILLDVRSEGEISLVKVQNNEKDTVSLWVYDRKGNPQWQYVAAAGAVSIPFPIALKGAYAFWISADGLSLVGYHTESQSYFSKSLSETTAEDSDKLFFDGKKSVTFKMGMLIFRDEGGELIAEDNSPELTDSLRAWFSQKQTTDAVNDPNDVIEEQRTLEVKSTPTEDTPFDGSEIKTPEVTAEPVTSAVEEETARAVEGSALVAPVSPAVDSIAQ